MADVKSKAFEVNLARTRVDVTVDNYYRVLLNGPETGAHYCDYRI